jgi:tetraacyldisaccharide 4'-kinase
VRRWLEGLEQFAIDVILERRYGKRASLLRVFLFALSLLFRGIVQLRLWLFRKRYLRNHPLGCMVISVGNLTVGGTGKTPVVERLARTLQAGGRRVAILSRGYKSRRPPLLKRLHGRLTGKMTWFGPRIVSDGERVLLGSREAGDEPFMLASNLPGVVVLVDKDRVKSGRHAIEHFGADTLILDDGLQYLHLQHRLDIVLIDRQAPFGNEYLLPRGTLREPPGNLRRASYIFITKSERGGNEALIQRIRRYNRTAEIIECSHRPVYLQNVFTAERLPLETLAGKYVGAFSAIAAPESFEDGLKRLGAHVELSRRFIDHHRFTEQEIRSFAARCRRRDVEMVLTTEKDAVRFPAQMELEAPAYYLRVEIDILSGEDSWQRCVDRICRSGPPVTAHALVGGW